MDPPKLLPCGPPGINTRSVIQNTVADLEVLKEIDDVYFSDPKTFDAAEYVLENTANIDSVEAIEAAFTKLKRQQQVVTGKALHLISQQRDNCDREFEEVQKIRTQISEALTVCKEARRELDKAKKDLTVSAFVVIANHRKREKIKEVMKALDLIQRLKNVDSDVKELLKKNEFEEAIALITECKKEANTHKEFHCVVALLDRLQVTQEMTVEKLDITLANLCRNFDGIVFFKLRKAYNTLGKLQSAMEQLFMHYSTAIHEASFESVRKFSNSNELKFQDLCTGVPVLKATSCLLELSERLFEIMRSYYLLHAWHNENFVEDKLSGNVTLDFENNINREYIKQKLDAGLARIWSDVQTKMSLFLKNVGLEHFPFEKFVLVLGILKKLTQIAEVFCGDRSDLLKDFIKNESLVYIKNYHKGRLEELKLFLENEGWEACPVKSSFTILHLQEYKPFKRYLKGFKSDISKTLSDGASSEISQDDTVYIAKYFNNKTKHTPFEVFKDQSLTNDDIFGLEPELTDSDESDDELKKDYVEEIPDKPEKSPKKANNTVIITNTTLSLLRICGQYLQMCRYLKPIALDVIMLIFQMYDYYLFAIHNFFTSDLEVSKTTLYSTKLNAVLKRISNSINVSLEGDQNKPVTPELPSHLNLNDETNLHGLPERIVAVESLIFLAKQFETLQPYLESIVEPHQRMILEHFRDNTLLVSPELRQPVYMASASKSINFKSVLQAMSQVKWDLKEVALENSAYVDLLVRQIQFFSLRLDNVCERVPLNNKVFESIWAMMAKFVVHILVEGYSSTNKCSNAGRGLMQLDSTQILVKLAKISGLKPVPYQDYVDKYVKAYYFPRNLLEEFVKNKSEYSVKHLTALICCACENKRDRQEFIELLNSRGSS